MSQNFSAVPATGVSIDTMRSTLNDNDAALRSQFSGTSFPSSPVAGQAFFNTSSRALYVYDGTGWRALFADVAAPGLLKADGSVAATNDIPFGGNKLTGVAVGSAGSDAVVKSQLDAKVLVASIHLGDLTATGRKILLAAPEAITILKVTLAVEGATTSTGSANWSINVQNESTSNDLLATSFNTNGNDFTALGSNDLTTDQNQTVAAGQVLTLDYTKTGAATDLTGLVATILYSS